ncbi:MAG: hypothetical protein GY906_23155 [bacterium]|nr:hypothetical protein [bacterium]
MTGRVRIDGMSETKTGGPLYTTQCWVTVPTEKPGAFFTAQVMARMIADLITTNSPNEANLICVDDPE